MNVTLRQIHAFVAVAECERFALAAQRLGVTPPALSMLIRQLELEIGARLFDRHTRQVRLTDIGAGFLPAARQSLADLEAALTRSREVSQLQRGRVGIATSTVLAATLLPWVIRRYCALHPGIRVVLKDMAEEEIQPRVRAGEVDIGVGTALDPDPELEQTLLLEDRIVALVPAGHALAGRRSISWRELAQEPLIVLGAGSPLRTLVERALVTAGVQVTPAHEVSFSSTAIGLVANGLGVAALPVNARQLTSKVKVAARPLVRPVVARRVCLFKRVDAALSPAAAAFRDVLQDFLQRGGYPPTAAGPQRARRAGGTAAPEA